MLIWDVEGGAVHVHWYVSGVELLLVGGLQLFQRVSIALSMQSFFFSLQRN